MQTEQQQSVNLTTKYPSDWHIGLSSDIAEKFNQAVLNAREWTISPTEGVFNTLISLYKQALVGDCLIDRPQGKEYRDVVVQWKLWKSLNGMAREEAAKQFIDLVDEMKGSYNIHAPATKQFSRGLLRAHFLAPVLHSDTNQEPVLRTEPSELLVDEKRRR